MSNKLVKETENNKKTQKKQKNYVRDPNFIPLHHGNSMDIALDKGSCKRFQTFQGTGEMYSFYSSTESYKRNYKEHKKGDPKLITRERQEPLYQSLAEAWKSVSETERYSLYIQASTGLNHKRREVLVLDFDANKYFDPLPTGEMFGYRSFDDAEKDINEFVQKTGLPRQSYIYYNKKSGNIQVGWFFDPNDYVYYDNVNHQKNCRQYLNMGTGLNKLWADYKGMPGDVHFTGWQCKNPYNHNYELRETKFYFINPNCDFLGNFSKILKITKPFFPSTEKEIKYIDETLEKEHLDSTVESLLEKEFTTYETKPSNNRLNINSRNYYEVKLLREWVWQYAREHKNAMPNLSEARKALDVIESKANNIIKGKLLKSDKELSAICKNVLNWSIKKYNKPGNNYYTDEQRHRAKLYNYAKMYANILRLFTMSPNLSCRQAAKKLGMSKSTISRYRNLSEINLKKIQILSTQFIIDNSENLKQYEMGNKSYNSIYIQKVLEIRKLNKEIQTKSIKQTKKYYYKRDGTPKIKTCEFFDGFRPYRTVKMQV